MGIVYKPKLTQHSLNDFRKLDGSPKKQIIIKVYGRVRLQPSPVFSFRNEIVLIFWFG